MSHQLWVGLLALWVVSAAPSALATEQTHDPYFVGVWASSASLCKNGTVPATDEPATSESKNGSDDSDEFEYADPARTIVDSLLGLEFLALVVGKFPGGQWALSQDGGLAHVTPEGQQVPVGTWASSDGRLTMDGNDDKFEFKFRVLNKFSNRMILGQEDFKLKVKMWRCQAAANSG